MTADKSALRGEIIAQCRFMNAIGLNQGMSGNISARSGTRMLITPSATPYDQMTPDMIASMPIERTGGAQGGPLNWDGPLKPSSEWRFHLDILRARPEIGAVVHTHPPHATALAMARREIPPAHYMIALFGGATVRCAPYARFGSAELSDAALAALEDRTACLLANHGMIALGATLEDAMGRAVELEALAQQFCLSLAVGGPVLLSEAEMAEAIEAFKSYGRAAPEA